MVTISAASKTPRGGKNRLRRGAGSLALLRRFLVPLSVVVAWELGSRFGVISAYTFPPPSKIMATFWRLTVTGELPFHLLVSTLRALIGLVIGVLVGTFLGLVSGLSRLGEEAVDSSIQMLRTIPHLAVIPLFIIWFGIDEAPKIILVAMGVTFYIYINLFAGIRGVDKKILEAGRTLGLSRAELIRLIILPGALPSFLVGLRYAIGMAWLSLVVGEQVNATRGIGYMTTSAREFGQTDIIFVGLIVYALLGLFTDLLIRRIEQSAFKWRPRFIET